MIKPCDILNSACAGLNPHIKDGASVRRQKYGNKKVTIDNIRFDSKKEAGRYLELRMQERCGLITDLKLQVSYELNEGGTHSLIYIADFVYLDDKGETAVEDTKGFKTAVFKKKARLMKKIYGIEIKIT